MSDVDTILRRLKPQLFERWLNSKPRTSHVGEAGESCRCPLANYIEDTTGVAVRVGENDRGSELKSGDGVFLLPDWADKFVHRLDVVYSNACADGDDLPTHKRLRSPDDHVEAREALRVLHDVWWPKHRRQKTRKKKGGRA